MLKLKQKRIAKRLKYEEVAVRFGVCRQTVYNWEKGIHKPSKLIYDVLIKEFGKDAFEEAE